MISLHRRLTLPRVVRVGASVATLSIFAGGQLAHAQSKPAGTTYTGKLDPELVENGYNGQAFTMATPADLKRLPHAVDSGSHAVVGKFSFSESSPDGKWLQRTIPAMAIITPDKPVVLYVNVTADSTLTSFTDKDKYVFTPSKGEHVMPGDQELVVNFPLPTGSYFHGMPVRVIESPKRAPENGNEHYFFVRGNKAQGTIDLGGRKTLAQFEVGAITGKVRTLGTYSLDLNGDGKIDEWSRTENQYRWEPTVPVMFKAGNTYVVPGTVDDHAGTFTMQGIPESEYVPPMDSGVALADFTFGTLDGATKHLSDYRGKYVLLDFWTVGCGPCWHAMPGLDTVYKKYHDRGFDIIGVNLDEHLDLTAFQKLLTEHQNSWTNTSFSVKSTGADMEKYVNLHCRVHAFPTTVLLGPDGKIIYVSDYFGYDLPKMLDQLLPAAKPAVAKPASM